MVSDEEIGNVHVAQHDPAVSDAFTFKDKRGNNCGQQLRIAAPEVDFSYNTAYSAVSEPIPQGFVEKPFFVVAPVQYEANGSRTKVPSFPVL